MSLLPANTNNDNIFCVLVSETDNDQTFVLVDKEPTILGRMKRTGIEDQRLSKKQVKFIADYSNARVIVEQLGSNKSAINGISMVKGEKRMLYHNDKVSLLHDRCYTYTLNFKSSPGYGVKFNKRPIIQNDISPKKPRLELPAKWETIDNSLLVYTSKKLVHSNKVAAFDMDGTIIVTQSGKVFPVDYKDWKIYSPEVTKTIRELSNDGYKIVIFTNQGALGNKQIDENTFKQKVENIVDVIKTPVQVFVATQNDIYRKPVPGMWDIFVSDFNGRFPINKNESFFCGDAAGRPARTGTNGQKIKKDHSCCDRLFALNIGLKFYTPEEYFLQASPEEFILPLFNPNDCMNNTELTDSDSELLYDRKEMILMVGCPSSGKSFFAHNKIGCHDSTKIISRDTLGSWQKCVSEAIEFLNSTNGIVVIDNTNPDIESRKRFIDVAKSQNIPVRVFLMNTSKEHAKHNNKFRELTNNKHQKITDIIINMFFSKFEEPTKDEGIDEIVKINFIPQFNDSRLEKLYKSFLL